MSTPAPPDVLITNTVQGHWLLQGGRIAARGAQLAVPPGATVVDGSGCLVLPGLVDAHAHIDKTLWGTPWHAHDAGPALMDKIRREREILRANA